jgi:hypothetical protein
VRDPVAAAAPARATVALRQVGRRRFHGPPATEEDPSLEAKPTLAPVRLIALEEAYEWMHSAVDALAARNLNGAVYACHAGLEHGRGALAQLIGMLEPAGEEIERALG